MSKWTACVWRMSRAGNLCCRTGLFDLSPLLSTANGFTAGHTILDIWQWLFFVAIGQMESSNHDPDCYSSSLCRLHAEMAGLIILFLTLPRLALPRQMKYTKRPAECTIETTKELPMHCRFLILTVQIAWWGEHLFQSGESYVPWSVCIKYTLNLHFPNCKDLENFTSARKGI
jgi:hypothetical protein